MIGTTAQALALPLEPTPCPLCGQDDGEPVAVGSDFTLATSPDSFLALSCRACGLVYLNPAPVTAARARIYPEPYFSSSELAPEHRRAGRVAAQRALACCVGLPARARVLELGYGGRLHLEELRRSAPPGWSFEVVTPHRPLLEAARRHGVVAHAGVAGGLQRAVGYDAVLALHALEHSGAPLDELRAVRQLLGSGGRLVLVCHNSESAVGRRFQGRHWSGYDFPRHRALFGPRALRALAERSGFVIDRLEPVHYPPHLGPLRRQFSAGTGPCPGG